MYIPEENLVVSKTHTTELIVHWDHTETQLFVEFHNEEKNIGVDIHLENIKEIELFRDFFRTNKIGSELQIRCNAQPYMRFSILNDSICLVKVLDGMIMVKTDEFDSHLTEIFDYCEEELT